MRSLKQLHLDLLARRLNLACAIDQTAACRSGHRGRQGQRLYQVVGARAHLDLRRRHHLHETLDSIRRVGLNLLLEVSVLYHVKYT